MSYIPILLVEDNEIDIELVQRSFKKAGISNDLKVARDGVEAIEILKASYDSKLPVHQPHIILLDINMPRMDGFEFLKKIRSDDKMKRNIVFMMTTSSREQDVCTAYDFNVAGYILKENINSFFGTLDNYIRLNQFPGFCHLAPQESFE